MCDVCEAVGEVRGCEGEGYPTASERKREKRGREGALLHVEGKKGEMKNGGWTSGFVLLKGRDEEITLTGESQLGTGLCLSFGCIPTPFYSSS